MIEFGNTLRAAREAKGWTVRQLSDATHLAPAVIEDLESEKFSHIPAPIYGRGFVKLYCEAVGLDHKPLVTEFMEIMNGNRDETIKERPAAPVREEPVAPVAPVVTEQESLPIEEPKPTANPLPVETEIPPPPPMPIPEPKPMPQVPQAEEPCAPEPPPVSAQPLSRYAAPVRTTTASALSPSYWRLGLLAAGAAVLVAVLLLGIRALYHATATPRPAPAAPVAEEVQRPSKPAPNQTAPAKPRTPQKIPSLYMD